MDIEEAIKEMKSLSPSENAIETVLSELEKKDKIIDAMAETFSRISKGKATIEEDTEKEQIIKHFTKKVEEN